MRTLQNPNRVKVAVVQRKSNVSSVPFSLSVECRLMEPLEYLQTRSDTVNFEVISEAQLHTENLSADIQIVLFNKHLSSDALKMARVAKSRGVAVFFDLDDWVMGFPAYSGARMSAENFENFQSFMELADEVTVANERLLHEIRPFRNNNVELLTNGFYTEKYWPHITPPDVESKKIVLTNADFLKMQSFKAEFLQVIDDFFNVHSDWSLDYYGKLPAELKGKPYIRYMGYFSYPTHKERLIQEHYAFSITPLGGIEDRDCFFFNSCKNPFKFLDYAGLGIPGIYSCVPIYEGCIDPDRTGVLVQNTIEEWRRAMDKMSSDANWRQAIRVNGFVDVKNKHHMRFPAQKMEQLFLKYLR